MSGEVCWGVGGDHGSCGKRCGGGVGKCLGVWGEIRKDVWGVEKCGRVYGVSGEGGKRGRCREMCWGVGGGKEKCVGSGEVWGGCGKVYGVSGKVCWRVGKGCGEGSGEDVGKCVEVWGPNTLLIPHISLLSRLHLSLRLPLPPPHPITLSYTSFYTSSHIPPPSPPTPQHIFLLSPHLPSPSQSVAKLPCDEVSVAKLLWRSYWQPFVEGATHRPGVGNLNPV